MRIIMLRTDGGGSAEISCIHAVMSTFASFTVARHDVDKITICQALLIKQAVINFISKS